MCFGIYIHWPYCLSKCPYCDFFSKVKNVDQDVLIEEYLKDLEFYNNLIPERKVSSIFFGGGTPSLIKAANIDKIINKISKLWHLEKDVEISLEANPNTNQPDLFKNLHLAGINRLSLGIQALNDKDLRFFGRTHNKQEALKAAEDVIKNFNNHSIDLIYARPGQQQKDWAQELKEALSLGFKHISLYQLTIEPGTLFYKKGVQALDDEKATELYNFTIEQLQEQNIWQYEVSNFAHAGYECRHNLLYWQGDEYLGIGAGAHGRFSLNGQWQATEHHRCLTPLSNEERAAELLLMGLRLNSGINKKHFQKLCAIDFESFINQKRKKELLAENLIADSPDFIKATPKGRLVLNHIIEELYA